MNLCGASGRGVTGSLGLGFCPEFICRGPGLPRGLPRSMVLGGSCLEPVGTVGSIIHPIDIQLNDQRLAGIQGRLQVLHILRDGTGKHLDVWQRMRSIAWAPKLVWPLGSPRASHLSLPQFVLHGRPWPFTTLSVTGLQNEEAFIEHFVYARTRVLQELSLQPGSEESSHVLWCNMAVSTRLGRSLSSVSLEPCNQGQGYISLSGRSSSYRSSWCLTLVPL